MHCTSDSEINGGIIILFPFCSANFPISSPSVTHSPPIISFTGKKLGFTIDSGRFHNISLRQEQEMVTEEALKTVTRGHWVLLQVSAQCPLWWWVSAQLEGCSQVTQKIYTVGYRRSVRWLIIFFLAWICKRINIILICCHILLKTILTLPGGAGEITQSRVGRQNHPWEYISPT